MKREVVESGEGAHDDQDAGRVVGSDDDVDGFVAVAGHCDQSRWGALGDCTS